MHKFWWRTLWPLIVAALSSLLVWMMADAIVALLILLAWVILLLLLHLRNLRQLFIWLKNPVPAELPDGSGIWQHAFADIYQELRRYRRNETQLTSTLERLQQAAGALPDGVVVLDATDHIEWCNHKAEFQLGLNAERDRGQPIAYLVRQTEFANYLESYNYAESLKLKTTRNPGVLLELQLVPFGENQKLLICRDITHLEKLEAMRRDFIANVSHELKTPLTVVSGFLETLKDIEGAVPESLRHYFDLMEEQAGRMRRLVEDLLTLSQLESSQGLAQEMEIAMSSLLETLLNEAQGLSAGRHQIKIVKSDPSLHVYGNLEELRSAFGNLISNAIRYTPQGGNISIKVELRNGDVVFSVHDTGIGIDPQQIPRLTERFYRVDRSRSRETGGTGLGLSIVKHILTRHQGKLEIISKPSHGSTFSAVLPASRVLKDQRKSRARTASMI